MRARVQVELFLLAPRNAGLARGGMTATLLKRRNDLLEVRMVGRGFAALPPGTSEQELASCGGRGPCMHSMSCVGRCCSSWILQRPCRNCTSS